MLRWFAFHVWMLQNISYIIAFKRLKVIFIARFKYRIFTGKRSKVTFLAICFLIGWYFAVKVLAIGLLEFNVSSDLIQHVELGLACSWLFTNTTVLPRFQNVFMNVLEHWKKCSWAENVFWICSKLCYMFRDFVMNKDI